MYESFQEKKKSMIKKSKVELYTSMDFRTFLRRKTTSSDGSVSSKSTEKISWDKDKKNINVSTNWNNEVVEEDGLSNHIFYLLDKKPSDNEEFKCIRHPFPDNSFNHPAKQYKDSRRKLGFMNRSCRQD